MNTSTNPYAIVDNLPVDLGSCVLSIRLSTEKNMKIDIVSHQPFNFWVGGAMLYRILFSQECKPLFIPLSFFVWPLHYLSFFVWPLHYLSFLDLATTLSGKDFRGFVKIKSAKKMCNKLVEKSLEVSDKFINFQYIRIKNGKPKRKKHGKKKGGKHNKNRKWPPHVTEGGIRSIDDSSTIEHLQSLFLSLFCKTRGITISFSHCFCLCFVRLEVLLLASVIVFIFVL